VKGLAAVISGQTASFKVELLKKACVEHWQRYANVINRLGNVALQ